MTLARVPVRVRSERARVEVSAAAFPVGVPAAGAVLALRVSLGRRVRAGDVLLVLDDRRETLERDELAARRDGLLGPRTALESQAAAIEQTLDGLRREARAARAGAEARAREAEARAAWCEREAARQESLLSQGFGARGDAERARAEAHQARAAADALRRDLTRSDLDFAVQLGARSADIAAVRIELARSWSEQRTLDAAIARLDLLIARRSVRAPIDGVVGELVSVREGTILAEGARVATVVPDGALRVVAWFRPATAAGRVRAGQPVRVRLDGFAWAEWGVVEARTERVGSEDPDGLLRVECALAPRSSRRIALTHGMPGVADVEVERVSPASLVLRAAGRSIEPEREPPP